jgi:hypothetical protein
MRDGCCNGKDGRKSDVRSSCHLYKFVMSLVGKPDHPAHSAFPYEVNSSLAAPCLSCEAYCCWYPDSAVQQFSLSLILFALTASACSAPAPVEGDGWRQAGGLDRDMIPFVEVQPDRAKDGAVYRDAINRLCGPGRCVEVGFFLANDAIPPSGPRGDFFRAGGWGGYRPLAVYMGGEFTEWDCERAGEEAAPLSALCGEGAEEQYSAVLRLATRDGWVEGCGLPPFGGRKLVEQYAATLPTARRDQILGAYQEMFTSSTSGPDLPSDCEALRPNIESKAEEATATIKAAIAKRKAATG